MPIYEYSCRSCGQRFEKIVFGDAEPSCPSCQSVDVQKLLSTFAVSSSGGGKSAAAPPCGTGGG